MSVTVFGVAAKCESACRVYFCASVYEVAVHGILLVGWALGCVCGAAGGVIDGVEVACDYKCRMGLLAGAEGILDMAVNASTDIMVVRRDIYSHDVCVFVCVFGFYGDVN